MKIADVKAYPTSFPIPQQNRVALGIGTAVKRDAVVVKVTTDEGHRRLGRGAPRPRAYRGGQADRNHAETAHPRDGRPGDHRHLGKALPRRSSPATAWAPAPASRSAASTWRSGTSAARRSGCRCTACSAELERPIPAYAGGVSLGYQPPAELIDEARKSVSGGLQGDQVAPRRYAEERCRKTKSRQKGIRRRSRHPHRRQHRLPARGRAPGDAGRWMKSASAGWRSRSRLTTIAATARPSCSAARRLPPARTTTRASSSTA